VNVVQVYICTERKISDLYQRRELWTILESCLEVFETSSDDKLLQVALTLVHETFRRHLNSMDWSHNIFKSLGINPKPIATKLNEVIRAIRLDEMKQLVLTELVGCLGAMSKCKVIASSDLGLTEQRLKEAKEYLRKLEDLNRDAIVIGELITVFLFFKMF
jgi:hypothetical protein